MANQLAFDILARDRASAVFDKVGRSAQKTEKGLRGIGSSVSGVINQAGFLPAGLTSPVAAAGAAAIYTVKQFASFDQAMANVSASTGITGKSLDEMADLALESGKTTAFSATEAAGGIEALAKAGLTAEDIVGGGLAGALDLAAAGEIDVGTAAEFASKAMNQFGLSGKDVSHIADLLAAGAGKAVGDVSDLGMALAQSGQVASATGLSLEETVGTLSAFAQNALLGSDAGTSFKTMLQRLSNPAAEARTLMQELGLSAFDAGGNFVGIAEFAGQLERALADMTDEQRQATLATIFGSDAVRAATVLYQEGQDGIAGWVEAVNDTGFAAETADRRMDSLIGDLKELKAAFDALLIEGTRDSGAGGGLRSVVQGLTDFVDGVSAAKDKLGEVKGSVFGDFAEDAKDAASAMLAWVPGIGVIELFADTARDAGGAANEAAAGFDNSDVTVRRFGGTATETATATDGLTSSAAGAAEAIDGTSASMEYAEQVAKEAAEAVTALRDSLFETGQAALTLDERQAALGEAITAAKDAADGHTGASKEEASALRGVASDAHALIETMVDQGASTDSVRSKTESARKKFIDVAQQMGLTKEEARKLADRYGLIPDEVATLVELIGDEKAKADASKVAAALNAIKSRIVTVTINEVVQRIYRNDPQSRGFVPEFHSGGVIGGNLRRAHDGFVLRPDERIVIGQTGERILSRGQTDAFHRLMSSMGRRSSLAGSAASGGSAGQMGMDSRQFARDFVSEMQRRGMVMPRADIARQADIYGRGG